jgi:penicillin-binding protein 1C
MKNWILNNKLSKLLIILACIVFNIAVLNFVFPLPKIPDYSKVIYAEDGTLLTAYLTDDDKWRMKTELDEVSPDFIKAIIEKEDRWFYTHLGVNPFSLLRAFYQNFVSGERVSGASTITMQVARMLTPADRTYYNKLREIFRAFQLELHYSKDEILELYLSMLPFGGNIEGVKSASFIYFDRPPNKLSLSQAITLTIIPNNPNNLRLDVNSKNAASERNRWITKFNSDAVFDEIDLRNAYDEELVQARYSIPILAPHFCRFIENNFSESNYKTTLKLDVQKKAETLLLNYVNRVKSKNVTNGSILIIDNKNKQVIGYCGSADYYDNNNSGQVNGITAMRSPGSALKPAVYAKAFDMGILTPKMKLLDIPTDFGGYEPENYDQKFNGEVTADFALLNSLNVPSVRLFQKVGYGNMVDLLSASGFSDIQQRKKSLGLSLILGGCGVTLEQLTRFYTVFANDGKLRQLKYFKDQQIESVGIDLVSEGAAFLISEILSKNERPDMPGGLVDYTKLPKIAWKTGTSYGRRDAWAIGYNPNYTIGVWMGNFDGSGAPDLSGASMAVPLLFELFNVIDFDCDDKWFEIPETIGTRTVSSETGLLPAERTTNFLTDYYIRNVSTNKKSDYYKKYFVSEDENILYCKDCLPLQNYKTKIYADVNPELKLWYSKNNIADSHLPDHNPYCKVRLSGKGPQIISPSSEFEYFIEKDAGEEILLQAASENGVKNHFWYVNDKFYKKSLAGEKIFFNPTKGKAKIACIDERGRVSTISIFVHYL